MSMVSDSEGAAKMRGRQMLYKRGASRDKHVRMSSDLALKRDSIHQLLVFVLIY